MTTVFGWIAIAASIPVWLYFFTRVWALFKFIRSGGPTQLKRTDNIGKRLWRVIAEVFGHSHFKGKPLVNAAHWLVMVGFLFGILVWFEAYIQTFAPNKGWPWLSHWPVYHFVEEVLGIATVLVGADPASQLYVGMKHKQSEAIGMNSIQRELPAG